MRRLPTKPAWAIILILAALAAVVYTQQPTEAHPCSRPGDDHDDTHAVPCADQGHDARHGEIISVHGGRDQELTLTLTPPPQEDLNGGPVFRYLGGMDTLQLEFGGFDLSGAQDPSPDLFELSYSKGNDANAGFLKPEVDAAARTVTLTYGTSVQAAVTDNDTELIITIKQGTGILTPEIPTTSDNDDELHVIKATFKDGDEGLPDVQATELHLVSVRNPVSSTVPGEEVRVELHTYAQSPIHANEEIAVDFAGPSEETSFTVPDDIDAKNVTIAWEGQRPTNPSSVLVQGRRIIITVPPDDDGTAEITGDYAITFRERAGIRNPRAAGNRIISVFTLARPNILDEITAVIRRATTMTPPKGPRGSTFTLEGKGYADGTVTIFDGNDRNIDAGERLDWANTVTGTFTTDLTAKGTPGSPTYRVWTLDSNGVYHHVDFLIESALAFDPERLPSGANLRITVTDWDPDHGALAAVTVGGKIAHAAQAVEYEECFELDPEGLLTPDDAGTLKVDVRIPTAIPPGLQNVSAYGPTQVRLMGEDGGPPSTKQHCSVLQNELDPGTRSSPGTREIVVDTSHNPVASGSIEITGRGLRVIPESGARGQLVTIIGSGISRTTDSGRDIAQISLGGIDVPEDPARFEVPLRGEFALDVTVPENAAGGPIEVRILGRDGREAHGIFTVAAPQLRVRPGGGRQGAPFTATGTNFVAHGLISLYYGDGGDLSTGDQLATVVLADRKGAFTAESHIPYDAELGTRYAVTAVARTPGGSYIGPVRASAQHTVSAGSVEIGKDSACAGDTLTITGRSLPPWTLVQWITLGSVSVSPGYRINTDEHGAFTAEITVPALELGNQTLRVLADTTVYVNVLEMVPPPLSGPTERVLKELMAAGALNRAWRYDNRVQKWSFFDPDPKFSEFNDLEEVKTSEIIFLEITKETRFQGEMLYVGWNAIELK